MADLKSELSGSLCRLILGLMMTPAQFDAKMMRKAMEVRARRFDINKTVCRSRSSASLKQEVRAVITALL